MLKHNKKFWLIPLIAGLLLFGLLIILGGSAAYACLAATACSLKRGGTFTEKRMSLTEGPLRATGQAEPRQCTTIVQVRKPMVAIGQHMAGHSTSSTAVIVPAGRSGKVQ